MKVSKLIQNLEYITLQGNTDIEVKGLSIDSRKVKPYYKGLILMDINL